MKIILLVLLLVSKVFFHTRQINEKTSNERENA